MDSFNHVDPVALHPVALHLDDEAWVNDPRMIDVFRSDDTIGVYQRRIDWTTAHIQDLQNRLEASRQKLALCERMLDPNYDRAIQNRLMWECRYFIRRGFLYVQNARKLVPNIDPSHIFGEKYIDVSGVTIKFDSIRIAMGADYLAACHSQKYLIWLLDVFVWTRSIQDGDHAIANRVVQCLV